MPGAKARGTRITVLVVGGVDTKASYLTVCTIHHLHKLPTPETDKVARLYHFVCVHACLCVCSSSQSGVKMSTDIFEIL